MFPRRGNTRGSTARIERLFAKEARIQEAAGALSIRRFEGSGRSVIALGCICLIRVDPWLSVAKLSFSAAIHGRALSAGRISKGVHSLRTLNPGCDSAPNGVLRSV
jgi:hypothetical protein